MKKNVWMITLLFIVSSFSMKLVAEESLDALIKKCETMESVDMNVARTRNPETKEIIRETINIKFCKNPALLDEFVAVFKKNMDKAITANENRKGGQTFSMYFRFEEGKTYSLTLEEEGCVSISVITGHNSLSNSPSNIKTYTFPRQQNNSK